MRALVLAALLAAAPALAGELAWQGPVPDSLEASSHYLEVKGHTWHYVESGSGPPLVLLHGVPAQSYLWRAVIPHLADTHRVIVPDLLGYGRSDKDASIDFGARSQAANLEAFLAAMAFDEPVALAVTDLGSVLGLHWASRHEDDVAAIVLVEAAAFDGETWYRNLPMMARLMFSVFRGNDKLARRSLGEREFAMNAMLPGFTKRKLSDEEHDEYRAAWTDPDVRERVLMSFGPASMPKKGRTVTGEEPTALMDEYGPWLRDTDIPKLVLAATPGLLINKDEVRRIEETFANTTIVEIGKGLHFVQEDQPDTIGTEMARWLGTVQRATTAVE